MFIVYPAYIVRKEDNAVIPIDVTNADYGLYLAWLNDNNTPEQPAPVSFEVLKRLQFLTFNSNRADYLDALSGIAGRASRANDPGTAAHCDRVAEGLLVLKTQPEVTAAVDLIGLQKAMLYCYNKLLVDVPANVRAVFAKVQS